MIEIRHWRERDKNQISAMIEGFLKDQVSKGGDVLPSYHNIDWHWCLGLDFSNRQEPTFAAVDEKGKVLCFILAGPTLTDLQLKYKTLTVYAMYTLPSRRSEAIWLDIMRGPLYKRFQELRYDRGISPVLMNNRKVMEFLFMGDAWPVSVNVEWRMRNFAPGELERIKQ